MSDSKAYLLSSAWGQAECRAPWASDSVVRPPRIWRSSHARRRLREHIDQADCHCAVGSDRTRSTSVASEMGEKVQEVHANRGGALRQDVYQT